ncbi:ATP-binding protein [bacterium]|nr:ATP-binding protein [bacterium]
MLEETIGRQALIALSNQYDSVADALMEIIDNPFDYRRGRHLNVDVNADKPNDVVTILDYGGEGMDDASLRDWISWGTGHAHSDEDIGQWHVGGKLAAIYLADSLEIICRKHGDHQIFRFTDQTWGTRTSLYAGHAELLGPTHLPHDIAAVDAASPGCGFTRIRLTRLKAHRYETGILEAKLGNAYRTLLNSGGCRLTVNDAVVKPLEIPYAPSYQDREVTIPRTKLEHGVTVRGRIWITDRERFKVGRGVGLKAGIRTVFNGRLITDGEEFGHYLAGRGSLQRLVGEIEINHLRPNSTKDSWDKSSVGWGAIEDFMHAEMQPLVAFLNSLVEGRSVSRQQRKRAEGVRRSVEETLKRMQARATANGTLPDSKEVGPGGRAHPKPEGGAATPPGGGTRGAVKNPTEPPADPIGRLLRRVRTGVPPIDFDDLGPTSRTQQLMTDAGPRIVINTAFPLFPRLGETEEYLAETVFLHLLTDDAESSLAPKDLGERLNELLLVWAEVTA